MVSLKYTIYLFPYLILFTNCCYSPAKKVLSDVDTVNSTITNTTASASSDNLGQIKNTKASNIQIQKAKLPPPGNGFNYLTSEYKPSPFQITYDQNIFTTDNNYATPDETTTNVLNEVKYEDTTQVIESGINFTSLTGFSIKLAFDTDLAFFGIPVAFGGSLGVEWEGMNNKQKETKTITARSTYKVIKYSSMLNPTLPLNTDITKRLNLVHDYIFNKNQSTFVNETIDGIINDYGTHYISQVSIGGIIYMESFIKQLYWFQMQKDSTTIEVSAKIKFMEAFGLNPTVKYTVSEEALNHYSQSTKETNVFALGGFYKPGQSVAEWTDTLENNLVIIDKKIQPLYKLINSITLPTISHGELTFIRNLMYDRSLLYLMRFSKFGCLDRIADNYDGDANVHVNISCTYSYPKPFGGIWAILNGRKYSGGKYSWDCDPIASMYFRCSIKNFITNEKSCPDHYAEHRVLKDINYDDDKYSVISFYQCILNDGNYTADQVYFGGIYSKTFNNAVTGARSCPPYFYQQSLFTRETDLSVDECNLATICLTRDANIGKIFGIDFAGFITEYTNMNPWTNTTDCPSAYTKVPIFKINDAQFYYCARL